MATDGDVGGIAAVEASWSARRTSAATDWCLGTVVPDRPRTCRAPVCPKYEDSAGPLPMTPPTSWECPCGSGRVALRRDSCATPTEREE